ncbi:hypothetical protein HPP92_010722 [Vanilla planifolia]|uniref:RRM domain-containing protein n=1 Tax=Vanilla planifolia TaxID=51239 RepID=A0A835R0L5_VANPL|nr:hypothetical protein HPP92_010722 [Vanilla planifolia]
MSEDERLSSEEQTSNGGVELCSRKNKRLREALVSTENRGVCYLSRVPPHMDPASLRQILSKYGDVQRIYLVPKDPTSQLRRKINGGFRAKEFSEGWVEFAKKSVAKGVAKILNGEQIGGRRRSSFYYDIWNIKYLSKFKWDDLTSDIANKSHIREQRLAMEVSAAKRERDFYMLKVDRSHAQNSIKERIKKKQKTMEQSLNGGSADISDKVRLFPQNKPVTDDNSKEKPRLSKDFLAGVFAGGSNTDDLA